MLPAARRPDLLLVLLLAALLPLGRAQKQAEGGWLTGTLGELGFGTVRPRWVAGCPRVSRKRALPAAARLRGCEAALPAAAPAS